ncbi:hypothetical protein ACXZ65_30985 [Streptomyces aculeolatus]
MRTLETTNLSDLLNQPKRTLARLAGSRRMLLRRRDDEDLVLTTAARAAQDSTAAQATSRVFVELMRRPEGRTLVMDVLPASFPWVRYLPAHEMRTFSVELVETLGAAADLDNSAGFAQLITEWKSTAEVYADPELHAALKRDSGEDYGPVPEPGTAA